MIDLQAIAKFLVYPLQDITLRANRCKKSQFWWSGSGAVSPSLHGYRWNLAFVGPLQNFVTTGQRIRPLAANLYSKLDAGMWRYHANRMDARRSQFDLGRVDTYISRVQQSSCFRITVFYGVRAGEQKVCEWSPKIWKIWWRSLTD